MKPAAMKALSLAGLLLMMVGMLGLLGTRSLFARNAVEIAVQVAAFGLMVWARLTFGSRSFHATADPTPGGLVTTGPYRYVRHPIYTAICLFGWAGVVSNPSELAAALGVVLTAGAIVRMFCEERLVVERYPEYREYARRTKRMVPHVF
jgi:protein-S-isoprenylcysteine O-methyltransferase Ste14